ncbi:MAG TPA: prephenate dehydrogenase/arogenate dehydrogenase family protein [Roseiflexaceae bacterium]|nr:prephenate dehydrogenase/arogenate dehydrogenase family protein [Roseiflexaceae bacterium]HMP42503.1 prephenate dehydrogenase/arogenate dehydrogenase family protein [Roseiflexaceae bacterium]
MLQITIVGMGLIGTSIGMALRSAAEGQSPLGKITVTGYDSQARHTADARGRLAIDREARTIEEAIRGAQLVIIATPVQAVEAILRQIAPLLAPGTVVTDVASTKAQVIEWARTILPTTVDFIGGHPMAGREKSGPSAASPDLFQNAIYCITMAPQARPESLALIERMIDQIGAKLYLIDAAEHDAYVAGVSHLPFLLAAVLADVASRSPAWKEMMPLAASGFRDMTRLASGDAAMHRDICMTNREALTRWINEAITRLVDVREQLADQDESALLTFFEQAHGAREEWLTARPNLRPGEAEFESVGKVETPSLFGRIGRRPPERRK